MPRSVLDSTLQLRGRLSRHQRGARGLRHRTDSNTRDAWLTVSSTSRRAASPARADGGLCIFIHLASRTRQQPASRAASSTSMCTTWTSRHVRARTTVRLHARPPQTSREVVRVRLSARLRASALTGTAACSLTRTLPIHATKTCASS